MSDEAIVESELEGEDWNKNQLNRLDVNLKRKITSMLEGEEKKEPLTVIIRVKPKQPIESIVESFTEDVKRDPAAIANALEHNADMSLEGVEKFVKATGQFVEEVPGGPLKKTVKLWVSNALVSNLDIEQIKEISKRSDVERIELDRPLQLELDKSLIAIKMDVARNNQRVGTGKGVKVGVIDGEADLNHPALQGRVVHKKIIPMTPGETQMSMAPTLQE